jgi:LPS export ABC transporter protein LptC
VSEASGIAADLGLPDEQSDGVTLYSLSGDDITLEMHARHIDRYYKKRETYIDSLYVKRYDKSGVVNSTLKCEKAKIDEAKNVIVCEGNVIVISENGKLQTPLLTWDRHTDDVIAQNGVVLERPGNVMRGDMMKTDLNLEKVQIINVSAEGQLEKGSTKW